MDKTYQVIEVIGQGSGGIVYKALHTRLNKEVVIKQIKGAAKQNLANRTEVDLLKGLKHTYLAAADGGRIACLADRRQRNAELLGRRIALRAA